MSQVPQLPRMGNTAPRSRDSSPWVDLIAFLAILALGGILIALGRTTAGSLATICAALGGLYGVWKRFRGRDEASPTHEPDSERDDHPR